VSWPGVEAVIDLILGATEHGSRGPSALESTRERDHPAAEPGGSVEAGQSLVEYSLLLVLIAVIVLGGVWLMGMRVQRAYGRVATSIDDSEAVPTPTPTATPTDESSSWEEWYEVTGSGWRAQRTTYCVEQYGEHQTFYGAENWTDYVVRVKADLHRGSGYGVYLRATDVSHVSGYLFQYEPTCNYLGQKGCFTLRRVVRGREQYPFARSGAPPDYEWYNVARDLELEVEGSSLRVSIDGEEVLMGTDDEYTHGQVGLRAWDASEVCFWDFTIVFLEEPRRDRDDREYEFSGRGLESQTAAR
jgi:Flp pilus assembly pilin Flp